MEDSELTTYDCEKAETMKLLAMNQIGYSKQISLPVLDLSAKENVMNDIFMAAQYLNDLANTKGLRVFMHSAAGVTRTSTVLLTYMSLYKVHPHYDDLHKMLKWIRQYVDISTPNLKLVEKTIKTKREF